MSESHKVTLSRANIPTVRVILDTHGMDSYRIDVFPHLEYLCDTPAEAVTKVSEVKIYHPGDHKDAKLNMIEDEARGFIVALAQALNSAGILDDFTRSALRDVVGPV